MNRDEALALLRAQHQFPGPYEFHVVLKPEVRHVAVSAVVAGAGPGAKLIDVRERPSKSGTYLALKIGVDLGSAEAVLDVYEVLRAMDGIFTTL